MAAYTVPGMKSDAAERIVKLLQDRLNSLNDLALTLKHVLEEFHWFVRAHLETPDGSLTTGDARTEKAAAKRATKSR